MIFTHCDRQMRQRESKGESMTTEDKQTFAVPEEEQMQEAYPEELQGDRLEGTVEMRSKRNWKKIVLLSMLALIIMLCGVISLSFGKIAGYAWGKSAQTAKESQRFELLNRVKEEAKKTKTGFVSKKNDVIFLWTLKDLGLLSYNNSSKLGLTADQIVENYGLASGAIYNQDGLSLNWTNLIGSNQQDLSFEFEKYNNNYYLKSVSIRDLHSLSSKKTSKEQKENSDDSAYEFRLTTEEYQNLMKGDKNTGKGGTPLSEILKKHRASVEIETEKQITSEGEEYKSNRVLANVTYQVNGDYKTLLFVAQPDGEFLYIGSKRF